MTKKPSIDKHFHYMLVKHESLALFEDASKKA